ncbi:MAG: hypothetical protein NZ602_05075 [Thermoguttaceae bacterium]|nr:hypothetical protein [Thermoguttaceae bacterium]MDW8038506.1 hypothetical protein [Thermoguttaceae bacterium]
MARLLCLAAEAGYNFQVPELQMEVFVHSDASVRIKYRITFANSLTGQTIDIVDIGTPSADYDLKTIQANCRGHSARLIRPSEYVQPGFEVHLGPGQIPPGQQGVLQTEFTVRNLVFQDTTRSDYASLRITPTWFDPQFVTGTTYLKLAVHLPPGIQPEEVLHQGQPFSDKALFKNHVVVVWEWPKTRLVQAHLVGLSFPKRVMDRVIRLTAWDLFLHWFRHSLAARWSVGILVLVLFGIVYFRFTGGTGGSLFVVLAILLVVLFISSPVWQLASVPIVLVLLVVNEWAIRRRPRGYLPPIAYVEGGGIKRGLTAPEAACLLELPLGRVLGLVIFGLLKKGVLRQLSENPLVVEVVEDFRFRDRVGSADTQASIAGPQAAEETPAAFYRRVGQEKGVIIHSYEYPFLQILEDHPGQPVEKIDFGPALRGLIERVAQRMKGFDLQQTREYYRWIVRRAVQQAAAIGEIRQRQEHLDRQFEWVLMDDDWPTVFVGPYRPPWMRGPWGRPAESIPRPAPASGSPMPAGTPPIGPSSAPDIPGQPTVQDVAASFAGWAENTFGRLASTLTPGSLNLPTGSGGFVDLSGFDRLTGEFFQALAEARSSGGSWGGGGCACACAGCACACACAGGGR